MLSIEYASQIECFAKNRPKLEATPIILGAFFLLALGYLIGFLLGAFSYYLNWLIPKGRSWNVEWLRKKFGEPADRQTHLEKVFRERFGFEITAEHVEMCSWLCVFLVWAENPRLGNTAARWDAEALADRSIALASLAIAVQVLFRAHWNLTPWYYSLFFFAAYVAAAINYRYHREQRLWGRFQVFASLPSNTTEPVGGSAELLY